MLPNESEPCVKIIMHQNTKKRNKHNKINDNTETPEQLHKYNNIRPNNPNTHNLNHMIEMVRINHNGSNNDNNGSYYPNGAVHPTMKRINFKSIKNVNNTYPDGIPINPHKRTFQKTYFDYGFNMRKKDAIQAHLNRDRIELTGSTYYNREWLKQTFGAKFDFNNKVWYIDDETVTLKTIKSILQDFGILDQPNLYDSARKQLNFSNNSADVSIFAQNNTNNNNGAQNNTNNNNGTQNDTNVNNNDTNNNNIDYDDDTNNDNIAQNNDDSDELPIIRSVGSKFKPYQNNYSRFGAHLNKNNNENDDNDENTKMDIDEYDYIF